MDHPPWLTITDSTSITQHHRLTHHGLSIMAHPPRLTIAGSTSVIIMRLPIMQYVEHQSLVAHHGLPTEAYHHGSPTMACPPSLTHHGSPAESYPSWITHRGLPAEDQSLNINH